MRYCLLLLSLLGVGCTTSPNGLVRHATGKRTFICCDELVVRHDDPVVLPAQVPLEAVLLWHGKEVCYLDVPLPSGVKGFVDVPLSWCKGLD